MKRGSTSSTPPAKRRRFFIEDILDLPATQLGSGMADYIQELDSTVQHINKFKTTTCLSKFQIKKLSADPEQLLSELFKSAIDSSIKNSKEQGINPTHLGCAISSIRLDSDVYIPLRPLTKNTVDTILNRFLHVGQSKKKDGINLIGDPFEIKVTTLNRTELGRKRKIAGSGRRTFSSFHHRVKENNLIKVFN